MGLKTAQRVNQLVISGHFLEAQMMGKIPDGNSTSLFHALGHLYARRVCAASAREELMVILLQGDQNTLRSCQVNQVI